MELRDFSRKFAAGLIAATVLGGTAACTGSSSPSSNAADATSTTGSTSTASAAQQPTVGATATSPATSANTAQAANATSSCTGSEIKVTLGRGGAATGHDVVSLEFTNTGSSTCTLQGYPGAAITSGSTVILNATRTLNGYAGDERQLTSAPLVTLAPGAIASANLEWVVNNGEPCAPNGTGTLNVTPPNTTTTTNLRPMTAGTQGVCAGFEIHPVVAGTL